MKDICLQVAKVIAAPPTYEALLCEFCGNIFQDRLENYVCECGHTSSDKDTFWDSVTNVFDIQFTVDLFTREEKLLVNVLLGAPQKAFDNWQLSLHVDLF